MTYNQSCPEVGVFEQPNFWAEPVLFWKLGSGAGAENFENPAPRQLCP